MQGDVVEIRSKYNALLATYNYDAWGNVVSITNSSGAEITDTTHIAHINPIRYRSYYYDDDTGFYYLQSRYYDPAIGRFISSDSLMVVDPQSYGTNLFAYCGNNPVNRADPSGKFLNVLVQEKLLETLGCVAIIVFTSLLDDSAVNIIEQIQDADISIGTFSPIEIIGSIITSVFTVDVANERELYRVYPEPNYNAIYYGATYRGDSSGKKVWSICTGEMNYMEAYNWVWLCMYNNDKGEETSFGKNSSWGLYTETRHDAYNMAATIGEGYCFHEKIIPGQFKHFHPGTPRNRTIYGYKHIHVWYGNIV